MNKILLLTLISLSPIMTLKGQHCGWDNSYIIIVDVHDSVTGKIINGLEIILTDSTGKPYASERNLINNKNLTLYQNTDTLKFGQNLKGKSKEYSKVNGPFPFGLDHYMLIVYNSNYPEFNKNGNDLILIKDIDGDKNLGYFETTKVKFSSKNIVSLCTGNSIWYSKDDVYKVKITVMMKSKA